MAQIHPGTPSPLPAEAPAPLSTATSRRSLRFNKRPNMIICRCSGDAEPHKSLALFRKTAADHRRRITSAALSAVLGSCASLDAVLSGLEVHAFMLRNAVTDCFSESSLVGFYAKCGFISSARQVFDRMRDRDVVAWTIMLMAYSDVEGCDAEVIGLLHEMLSSGVAPNHHTFTVSLRRVKLKHGEQLHGRIVKSGCSSDSFIGSSLVDFYSRNGVTGGARLVFDRIEQKDAVCYNCLISAYGRIGNVDALISVYREMDLEGLKPNRSTLVGLLNGCANSGLEHLSSQFHAHTILRGFGSDSIFQGIVVDMYVKCGNLAAARVVFSQMYDKRCVVAWNSMICGCGKHGCIDEALRTFDSMETASVAPDHITFTCLLSACSHSGLVREGLRLFTLMEDVYRIPARDEHYCCVVDLLGRAGMVSEAYEFICGYEHEFGASVWGALLNACKVFGAAEIGEVAAKKLFELEPDCSGSYIALSNIFAANSRWPDARAVREMMDDQEIKKDPGLSWIEIGGVVHKFRAGKQMDHPSLEEIQDICKRLNSCISE